MQKHNFKLALFGLLYWCVAWFGLSFSEDRTPCSPIWPASGVALAGLLLGGLKFWPGIFLGSFAANLVHLRGSWPKLGFGVVAMAVLVALSRTLGSVAGARLAVAWAGRKAGSCWRVPVLRRLSIYQFMALAFGASLISASLGTTALCAIMAGKWGECIQLCLTWWLGDAAGILVVAPLVLAWSRSKPPEPEVERWAGLQVGYAFGLLILICWVVFVGCSSLQTMPVAFFAVGPLVWIAERFGPRCTTLALFVVFGFVAWQLTHPVFEPLGAPLLPLASMLMMAVVAHALENDSSARRRAEAFSKELAEQLEHRVQERTAELELSYARYRLVTANLPNSVVTLFDHQERCLFAEGTTLTHYGFEKDSLVGRRIWDVLPPQTVATLEPHCRAALEGKTELFEFPYNGNYFLISTLPVRDTHGQITSGMAIAMDITAQRRAEAALRESQQFAQATIDALSAHICVIDSEGTILSVNRTWRAFALANPPVPKKYAEGANYLEVCDRAAGRGCAEAGPFAAGIRAVIEGQRQEFSMEYPCPSPRVNRWFVGRVTPFPKTPPGCFVIAHEEITSRKLAERKVESALKKEVVLKREIHHRVKNNLQVVISLLYLQSARVSDPVAREILRDCQSRTRSIALIYALLSQSEDLTHIRFEDYARELASTLAATYRSSSTEPLELAIEAAGIYVNVDTALPCGLIMTELLSNSLKYAFPPGHSARVTITLRRPEPEKLELSVRDNGTGLPPGLNLDYVSTMGLTLVRDLVRQLNGAITIKTDEGTGVWVTFPG